MLAMMGLLGPALGMVAIFAHAIGIVGLFGMRAVRDGASVLRAKF